MRILLADDHARLREALRMILEREEDMDVVAEAEDGESAVRLTLELQPDIVVLDIRMPVLNGIEAARKIRQQAGMGIVFLTMHGNREYIVEAMKLGAISFILKDTLSDDLVPAVRSVYRNVSYLSPTLDRMMAAGR